MERRLDIAEMAALYQISARTLRYYEEIGILQSHRKPDSQYREYDREQCERLEIILLLRRLSFSVKTIHDLLLGDDAHFRAVLREKIAESGRRLLEARETDNLLRDLDAALSRSPATSLRVAESLRGYTYLTKKTERMIPMNYPQNEKYRVALGMSLTKDVCYENTGDIVRKIGALRAELGKSSVSLPTIRVYDTADLAPNQAVVVWNGREVMRKDYKPEETIACADEIIARLKQSCLTDAG